MENTYRIPAENIETLREKIAKLAKRAAKLGVEIPTLRIVSQEEVIRWFDGGAYFETEEQAARYTSHPIRVVNIFHPMRLSMKPCAKCREGFLTARTVAGMN